MNEQPNKTIVLSHIMSAIFFVTNIYLTNYQMFLIVKIRFLKVKKRNSTAHKNMISSCEVIASQ